ncbi:protein TAP1 [Ricinus communis]|uniref:protein TAP1 n=1 Tax=Ricinus communis TaxID=3988 RepID=UPI00201A2CEB|nr:protein TAP1 [Ricinus communis]
MDGKGVKTAAGLGLIVFLSMLLGQAAGEDFKTCYVDCYLHCIIDLEKGSPVHPKDLIPCAVKCLKECLITPPSSQKYYCSLGCSFDTCTGHLDDAEKTGSCVEHCSNNVCKK